MTENATLVKYSVLGCSRDRTEDYIKEMKECLEQTARLEYKQLLEKRLKLIWEQKWKDSDVLVEGCKSCRIASVFDLSFT